MHTNRVLLLGNHADPSANAVPLAVRPVLSGHAKQPSDAGSVPLSLSIGQAPFPLPHLLNQPPGATIASATVL